jgi:hypothetical protein
MDGLEQFGGYDRIILRRIMKDQNFLVLFVFALYSLVELVLRTDHPLSRLCIISEHYLVALLSLSHLKPVGPQCSYY